MSDPLSHFNAVIAKNAITPQRRIVVTILIVLSSVSFVHAVRSILFIVKQNNVIG